MKVTGHYSKLKVLMHSLLAIGACVSLTACGDLKTATEYLISGNEAFKAGDYELAEQDYKKALKLEPKSSTALNNLGVVLNELKRYQDAKDVLTKAIELDPKNSIAHYALAKSLTRLGEYDGAIAEAQKATELAPSELEGHRVLAEAALGKARATQDEAALELAIGELKYILQADSDDDMAHQHLGEALALQKDLVGAQAESKKALELNPDNVEARMNLAEYLQKSGDPKQAIAELEKILQKNPKHEQAKSLKAAIEGGSGDAGRVN